MQRQRLLFIFLILGGLLLALIAFPITRSVRSGNNAPSDYLTPQPGMQTVLAHAPTVNAQIATAGSQLPIASTIPNGPTRTALARGVPTCVAEPSVVPTPVVATGGPNDPYAALSQTAFASGVAARSVYVRTREVDLAPQIPRDNKWYVEVGQSDCTEVAYLVSDDMINTFPKTLSSGSYLVNVFPPTARLRNSDSGRLTPVTAKVPTPGTPASAPAASSHP